MAMKRSKLRRRYGRAVKRKPREVTVHQCPGCGEPVAVKRVVGSKVYTDDDERQCPRCQAATRRALKRLAHERVEARKAVRPHYEFVHDALGFPVGEAVVAVDAANPQRGTAVFANGELGTRAVVRGPEGWHLA
jgi:hypothetical protein